MMIMSHKGMAPLHIAVSEGNAEAVNILCSNKASLTLQEGTYGRSALHIAIEKNSYSSCLILLKSVN